MKQFIYQEIENQIKNVLINVSKEGNQGMIKSDTQWTHRIKELLGNLGESLDLKVCTGGFPERFEPEWLYDMVWYKEGENNLLARVPLVMESEWGRTLGDVKYDFEKLLLSNAELRLMVCQAKPDQVEEFENYFKNAVPYFVQLNKGDRFLIAIFEEYVSDEFKFLTIEK